LGRVMGAITVLDAGGGALGPWITAVLSDRSGNYQNGFLLICGLILLAIVCASALRMRKI
jgi:cyanate permease